MPCNLHKNFLYVISALSSIILWKISYLARRVIVSDILRPILKFTLLT